VAWLRYVTSSKYHKDSLVALEHTKQKCRIKQALDRKNSLGLVWMHMYSSQSTCVGVNWSGIKLNSIPVHSTTCGLKWIHMHPNKALRQKQRVSLFA
jgi:hypothetical protein